MKQLSVPCYINSTLGQTQLGWYDPQSNLPKFDSDYGIFRIDLAYQFDLIRPISQIQTDIGAAVAALPSGAKLVMDVEGMNLSNLPNTHQAARFIEINNAFKSWGPPNLQVYWFGGPLVGSSYTDLNQIALAVQANKELAELGFYNSLDGIAWGMYAGRTGPSAPADLASFRDQVLGALQICNATGKPTLGYIWNRYFPVPSYNNNDKVSRSDWQYMLLMCKDMYRQKLINGVVWYTPPADGNRPKWDNSTDLIYLADIISIFT